MVANKETSQNTRAKTETVGHLKITKKRRGDEK